jgi:hypothetical protein
MPDGLILTEMQFPENLEWSNVERHLKLTIGWMVEGSYI